MVVALNADIRSLEPGVNRDANTDAVIHQVFEGLVAFRADLGVGPALADSWEVGDEGKTYTFKLRAGALFHNGQPITSAEVKWMWDRLVQGAAWACRTTFDGSSGVKVVAVETPDPRTVVFRLDQANALFIRQLANIQCHVVAAHPGSVDASGKWTTPIGSGPLRLREWRRSEYVLLERFADYKPSTAPASGFSGARNMLVDQVMFRIIPDSTAREAALTTGAVDVLARIEPEQIEPLRQRGMRIVTTPGLGWAALLVQTDDPVMANPKIRQALAHAISLKDIAEARAAGMTQANPSGVSNSTAFYDPRFAEWPAYDPARAAALLREAGYRGQPIKLQTNRQYPGMYQNAVVIEAMLTAAGFKVELEVLDWATQLSNYLNGRFQLQSFAFSVRFDPTQMYTTFIGNKAAAKTAQYGDPEAIALLAESARITDDTARREIFARIHAKVRADMPIIGLYYDPVLEAIHPRVQGYVSWPANQPITWGVRTR
ncbi:ABC transporter substrate-binding protein [Phreatobacter stygius]|uniref:ABC transporter substrate-binding protein n=1 Tax=Phreatobacter stygius TaxID=1940610 RepID=A0A4D7BJ76_9HYPH|nr:ABC transporter substrate-binding protein [Phreatobacter stygius]